MVRLLYLYAAPLEDCDIEWELTVLFSSRGVSIDKEFLGVVPTWTEDDMHLFQCFVDFSET